MSVTTFDERLRAVKGFAEARGWRVSKRFFTPEDLRAGRVGREKGNRHSPEIDHAQCFFDGFRHPVALLTHSYAPWEQLVAFAEAQHLSIERLPVSWYNPDGCIAALLTRKISPERAAASDSAANMDPSLTAAEIAAAMSATHYMSQLHRKRYRIVLWRPNEMFPQPLLMGNVADKKAALRSAGLDPAAALPLWDEMLTLLPEAALDVELSRRDAEGFKQKLSAAEICAYKRSGVLPVTKAKLNEAVRALAQVDRPAAVAILARFNALNTVKLPPEKWRPVFDEITEALKKFNASTP